jgi:hypothetical protein
VVVCGLGHSVFATVAAGHNRGLAVLITGVPFLVAGALFMGSGWRDERAGDGSVT